VRNWTLRELLLLAVFLTFVIWHAYDAARVRFGRMERFEITPAELETWAKEIDPSVRLSAAGDGTGAINSRTTPLVHWEFDVPLDQIDKIFENWRLRVGEKIHRGGWTWRGGGSGKNGETHDFSFRVSKSDSRYTAFFYAEPTPGVARPKDGTGRTRLSVEWIVLGYSRRRNTSPATDEND
jgi:hypothetical protein